MSNKCWILIALLSFSFGCGKKATEDGPRTAVIIPGVLADQFLLHVNEHRIKLGLNPLESAEVIEEQAFEHSRAMAAKKRSFGHYGKGLRCQKIRDAFGSGRQCGEIIAMGPNGPQEVFDLWIRTTAHRQLLEAAHYTHSGLGFEKDADGVMYWTLIFYAIP